MGSLQGNVHRCEARKYGACSSEWYPSIKDVLLQCRRPGYRVSAHQCRCACDLKRGHFFFDEFLVATASSGVSVKCLRLFSPGWYRNPRCQLNCSRWKGSVSHRFSFFCTVKLRICVVGVRGACVALSRQLGVLKLSKGVVVTQCSCLFDRPQRRLFFSRTMCA